VGAFPGKTPHLFIDCDPATRITWIATGIGDVATDAVLLVSVDESGVVRIRPQSLSGKDLGEPEDWSHKRWMRLFFPEGLP